MALSDEGTRGGRALKSMIQHAVKTTGYYIGQYPPVDSLAYHLRTVFRELAIDVVIDVGAHMGEFSGSMRELGFAGEIWSFEPVSATFEKLQRARKGDKHWRGFNCALGREAGELELNLYEGSVFNSFLPPDGSSRFEKQRVVGTEKVAVRKLESVLDELFGERPKARVFVKLDTQGYDLEVLHGAGRRRGDIRAIMTELAARRTYAGQPSLPEALVELDHLGFDLSGMFPVARELDHLRIIELDCVMVARS